MSKHPIVFIEPTAYQRVVGILVGAALIVITVRLMHKFRLREEHGLPWLAGGALLIVLCVFMPALRLFTRLIGAGSPTTALFAGSLFFLLVHNLYLTSVVSRQKKQIQDLAIEQAIVKSPQQEASDDKTLSKSD